ncbi:MAG: nucleotide exchange factor GrpE [Planctomycetaceae bacterium]|nr:nucleotide exchange factor GrpE [Planctomycetaceae bacterium]
MSTTNKDDHPESNGSEHNEGSPAESTAADQESAAEDTGLAAESEDEIRRLRGENEELQNRLLRTQAELENFRRRTMKEAADAMKYQSLPVIRDLLPGIDNLQRAVEAAEKTEDLPNLISGIRMVAQQFQDALKSHSAEVIDPVGEAFDPNLHEALTQIPTADQPPMTVLQVVERGYRIHDRVVRPAKVVVSCAMPEA